MNRFDFTPYRRNTVGFDRLFELLDALRTAVGLFEARCFVDSAPVMERAWAERSGLGWVGKNSLLLRKNTGSYFF